MGLKDVVTRAFTWRCVSALVSQWQLLWCESFSDQSASNVELPTHWMCAEMPAHSDSRSIIYTT
jgi:hypothetical protein